MATDGPVQNVIQCMPFQYRQHTLLQALRRAGSGKAEIVNDNIDYFNDVNFTNENGIFSCFPLTLLLGQTLLFDAVLQDQPDFFNALIAADANVNFTDSKGIFYSPALFTKIFRTNPSSSSC